MEHILILKVRFPEKQDRMMHSEVPLNTISTNEEKIGTITEKRKREEKTGEAGLFFWELDDITLCSWPELYQNAQFR